MLEMRAIVIQVEGDEASVQPIGTGGCGSGALTKLFCSNKPRHFKVSNKAFAKVGDEVQVSIPDGVLLRGAVKMYMLPLVLLLGGGFAGVSLAGDVAGRDVYAVAGAVLGLLLGFVLAKLSPGAGQAVAISVITSKSGY